MKLGLTEWGGKHTSNLVDFVDLVQPRFLIPTHYRTDSVSDPIPHGTWPPNVTDVLAFIEWIRETVGDRTKVLPFTAGIEYELEMRRRKCCGSGIGSIRGRYRRGVKGSDTSTIEPDSQLRR